MNLEGKKVAILATDGFEQSELESPRDALRQAGATPTIVAPRAGNIRGWREGDWGDSVDVDVTLGDANPADYVALVLPGGVLNPDSLRTDDEAVEFVRHFVEKGKPIGAICHGPWMLIEARGVKGKRVTSWPSVRTDLENAGAKWEDREVVVDQGLVTSRKPDDLPAFNAKLVEEVYEGRHAA